MEKEKNLEVYDSLRKCPKEALKTIGAGRLKGMSDINPMWRIKMLTEHFGPVGKGWYYKVTRKWTETMGNEVRGFVDIELYVKYDGEWSMPIEGTGGASYATQEKNGLYVSDEVYKMALTDAISVACKALGMAADVYWTADVYLAADTLNTKYAQNEYIKSGSATPVTDPLSAAIAEIGTAKTTQDLATIYNRYTNLQASADFLSALTNKKNQILNAA